MTAGVYAELTASGDRIILAATGTDWELDTAAAALRRLTPLLRPTEPKGMLSAPATWAAVTQLAHTFSTDALGRWIPGPRLKEWVLEEFTRRTAASPVQPATGPEPAASPVQPAKTLVPRPYQLQGAAMIAAAGRFLLLDDPGTGKTATAILGLKQRQDVFPLVIVVPSW